MPEINYSIRPATARDSRDIRGLIWRVGINPMSLDWRRFLVAVDDQGKVLGCGQIKPHRDGTHELASIAVQPAVQQQGIGSAIIRQLVNDHPAALYLTCRASLGNYYRRFGFELVTPEEMPPYFRRLARLVKVLKRLVHFRESLLIMVRRA